MIEMPATHKDIEARRRALLEELARLDQLQAQTKPSVGAKTPPRAAKGADADTSATKTGRSLRDLVLDALDEIGFMTYTQQLTLYIKARFGRDVNAARFGTLSADEENSFARRSSRSVWLCHGLTHDRAEPVKR